VDTFPRKERCEESSIQRAKFRRQMVELVFVLVERRRSNRTIRADPPCGRRLGDVLPIAPLCSSQSSTGHAAESSRPSAQGRSEIHLDSLWRNRPESGVLLVRAGHPHPSIQHLDTFIFLAGAAMVVYGKLYKGAVDGRTGSTATRPFGPGQGSSRKRGKSAMRLVSRAGHRCRRWFGWYASSHYARASGLPSRCL
jgi:hypothetical protein